MRSIVKFEKNEPIETDSGGERDVYVEFLTTRGYLRTRSGSRSLAEGDVLMFTSHELICRFQPPLENELRLSVRIVIDNRFYTISSWEMTDEKKFYYRFQINQANK